jgi:hypothetical protein
MLEPTRGRVCQQFPHRGPVIKRVLGGTLAGILVVFVKLPFVLLTDVLGDLLLRFERSRIHPCLSWTRYSRIHSRLLYQVSPPAKNDTFFERGVLLESRKAKVATVWSDAKCSSQIATLPPPCHARNSLKWEGLWV